MKLPTRRIKSYIYLRVTRVEEVYGAERIVFAVCPEGFVRIRLTQHGLLDEKALPVLKNDAACLTVFRA